MGVLLIRMGGEGGGCLLGENSCSSHVSKDSGSRERVMPSIPLIYFSSVTCIKTLRIIFLV